MLSSAVAGLFVRLPAAAETGKGTRLMDLLDALAVSMLPASRARVAAAFKDLRHVSSTADPLLATLAACRVPEEERVGQAAVARSRAVAALDSSRATPIVPVAWDAAEFPPLLGCIPDPPPVVWTLGNLAAATLPAVAIVGSRAATTVRVGCRLPVGAGTGRAGAGGRVGACAGRRLCGAPGLPRRGGSTVAVLGSGLDHIYPREHEALAQQIRDKGCLISELWPGAWPLPEHFPLRNRIISGISLAVVVVEASENSGSLITARYALEQGRDVMAVPGNVLTGRNRGSHSLLKDGAKVVESADDILDGLGWPVAGTPPAVVSKLLNSDSLLSRMEAGEVYRLEELMELTGVTGTKLLARLMELELAGVVTQTGSGFSRRLVT